MGFEDDFSYNNDFETDIADPDNMDFGEQPKKLSRKELREAKKKNAEKTADLPKKKRGLLGRRERLDDNDETLTDEHIFDPSRSTMISAPRDRSSRENRIVPKRNTESEFSYLFDPVDDDESEDDVYPESSVYSDSESARELLAGLSYDESNASDVRDFESYFEEHSEPPEPKFSFKKKNKKQEEQPEVIESVVEPEPSKKPSKKANKKADKKNDKKADKKETKKVTPKKTTPTEEESFLPEMRPDSVFASLTAAEPQPVPEPQPKPEPESAPEPQPKPAPTLRTEQRNDPPLPPLRGQTDERPRHEDDYYSFGKYDRYDKYDDPDEDEYYMNNDQDKINQDYIPYGGLYPSYPANPMNQMNQMMPYPVVIPNSTQNQSGNYPIQTIPIPYPMPMPMPMPMYGQYPSYPPQYPQYPSYPPQESYERNEYEERRDSGRKERRFNEHRRRDDRYDDRRDRYDDRDYYYDRRDDRYDDRCDGRYDDRRDGRYDDRRDGRYDDRYSRQDEPRRESYPQPPYEPPYRRRQEDSQPAAEYRRNEPVEPVAPVAAPQPVPEPIQAAAPEQNNLSYTPSPFENMDFSFHTPPQETAPADNGLENAGFSDNTPVSNDFEDAGFDEFSSGSNGFENGGFEENTLGNDIFTDSGFEDYSTGDDGFGDDPFGDNTFGDNAFGDPPSDNDSFGDDPFGDGGFGDMAGEQDDFGLGFGGRSISSDRPSPSGETENKETRSTGGRFKKRK